MFFLSVQYKFTTMKINSGSLRNSEKPFKSIFPGGPGETAPRKRENWQLGCFDNLQQEGPAEC